jgi:hypothetical protein
MALSNDRLAALQRTLVKLSGRERVLALEWLGATKAAKATSQNSAARFLSAKRPRTNIDRIVCIAAHLTAQGVASFRTRDLSRANDDAGAEKFSNAALAVRIAKQRGYFASVKGGKVKLSPSGKQYVQRMSS